MDLPRSDDVLGRRVNEALDVIYDVLETYGCVCYVGFSVLYSGTNVFLSSYSEDHVAISFNGGKDCEWVIQALDCSDKVRRYVSRYGVVALVCCCIILVAATKATATAAKQWGPYDNCSSTNDSYIPFSSIVSTDTLHIYCSTLAV